MDADEFRDYILGFIFFKYLSERMHLYANSLLSEDNMLYTDIDEHSLMEKNIWRLFVKRHLPNWVTF
jgi:type I restriction enzyme M protein